jgi:nucleoside 2-deoxyribosyltransferase
MKIHFICPVRGVTEEQQKEIDDYAKSLEAEGHTVHNPKYAVDQDDATGFNICSGHLLSMVTANRVDVFWDVNSKGSHFDLGMAFALQKPVKLIKTYQPDNEGKSYVKVMLEMQKKTEKQQAILDKVPAELEIIRKEKLTAVKEQKFEVAVAARQKEKDLIDILQAAKNYFNLYDNE